jgi:hypothetical protein
MKLLQMQWQQQHQQKQRRSDPPAAQGTEELTKSRSSSRHQLTHSDSARPNRTEKPEKLERKGKKKELNSRSSSSRSKKECKRSKLAPSKSSDSMSATGHPLPPELLMTSDHSEVDLYSMKPASDSEFTAATVLMTDSERSEEDQPRLTPVLASGSGKRATAPKSSTVDDKSVKTQKTRNTVNAAGAKTRKSKKVSKKIDDSVHTATSSSAEDDAKRKVKKKSKSSSSDSPERDLKKSSQDKQKRTSKSKSKASSPSEDGKSAKAVLLLSAEQVAARLEEIGKLEQLLWKERKSLEESNVSIPCDRHIFELFFFEEVNRRHELASEVTRLQLQLIDAHQGEQAAVEQSAALQVEIEKARAKLKKVQGKASQSSVQELQKENDVLKRANEKLRRELDVKGAAFATKLRRKEETVDYLIGLLGKMEILESSSHHKKNHPLVESPKSIQAQDQNRINETGPVTPTNAEATKNVLVRLMKPKSLKNERSRKKKVSRSDLDADALKPPLIDL